MRRSGNPVINNQTVITREYLLWYYKTNFLGQSEQFQKLFIDIVNLCNQFSYYNDSFSDIYFQTLRQDSLSSQLQLKRQLEDVREFQRFSKELMNQYLSIAQCSELRHTVRYSSEVSIEFILIIVVSLAVLLYIGVNILF